MKSPLMNQLQKKFEGKKILIVGLGLQGGGVGLVKFFCSLKAKVKVTDLKNADQLKDSIEQIKHLPIEYTLGSHKKEDFIKADIIFKGPSVPWDLPEIKLAKAYGKDIEMEVPFFVSFCPGKIIGVTGTRGKSTTSLMIYKLLKKFGFSIYLAGNIPGISTINLLNKIKKNDWVVLELSSWALSGFHQKKISPHIAVFTNFYPDHLNYYVSIIDYFDDKKAIYLYQKEEVDYLIANSSLKKLIKRRKNVFWFSKNDFPGQLNYLKGDHNLENASAVWQLVSLLKLNKKKALEIIQNFKGLPFRQEIIAKKNNILFVNDSTSTTPIACVKAIESFKNKQIILILGGNTKNLPFEDLLKKLRLVKKIILLKGSFTDQIFKKIKFQLKKKLELTIYDKLSLALNKAYQIALNLKGRQKVILFSPAATSFSLFNNEFDRGQQFNRLVKKIIRKKNEKK